MPTTDGHCKHRSLMTRLTEWLETARADRWGLLVDLTFAVCWVTLVEVLFRLLDGPTWAYYTLMLGGIVAYFGLIWNLELARAGQREE